MTDNKSDIITIHIAPQNEWRRGEIHLLCSLEDYERFELGKKENNEVIISFVKALADKDRLRGNK